MRRDGVCHECGEPCWPKSTLCSPCRFRVRRQRAVADVRDRFMPRVDTSAGMFGCWPWLGSVNPDGYGWFWLAGRNRRANQVALELHLGRPLGPGMQALHHCDNPPCCNPGPGHLFEGTNLENHADKVAKGRQARPIGEAHPMARLTDAAVREIQRCHGTQRAIAAEFGVSQATIQRIQSGRGWAHLLDRAVA